MLKPGTRFGKLTVIEAIGYKPQYTGASKNRMWYKCHCDCGNIFEVSGNRLKENHTVSCGCIISKGEAIIANLLKQQLSLLQKQQTLQLYYPSLCPNQHNSHQNSLDILLF